jgi:hypothetical protein
MTSRNVVNRVVFHLLSHLLPLPPVQPPLRMPSHALPYPTLSLPMEHQEPNLGIHLPPPRMALILNLIVRSQMPLPVPLTAPKRIVAPCIRRLDAPGVIRAALRRDSAVFHLYVFARGAVVARLGRGRMRTATCSCAMAVRHVVCRSRSRGAGAWRVHVGLRGVAVGRGGGVVGALVGGVEVSKRVQRTVQGEVVEVAVYGGVVVIGIARAVAVVGVLGDVRTDPGVVAACLHANADAHSDTGVAHAVAHTNAAIRNDASGRCAVRCLAGVAEEAALTVPGGVDVLVAGLGPGLHSCGGGGIERAANWCRGSEGSWLYGGG